MLLDNLITNAVEAARSKVEVWTFTEFKSGQLCAGTSVADDGSGIATDTPEQIFEPFYSTKTEGRGLGLASVLLTVKAFGGEVVVQSRPEDKVARRLGQC